MLLERGWETHTRCCIHTFSGVGSSRNPALGQNYLTFGSILHIYTRLPLSHKIPATNKDISELKKQRSLPFSLIQKRRKNSLPTNVRSTYQCVYTSIKPYLTYISICRREQEYPIHTSTLFNIFKHNLLNQSYPSKSKPSRLQSELNYKKEKINGKKTAVAMRLPFYPRRRSRESGSLTSFSSPRKLIIKCSCTSSQEKPPRKNIGLCM